MSGRGSSTCGSLVDRHRPETDEPAQVEAFNHDCAKALVKQGGAAVGFAVVAATLAGVVTLSRRRALLRYDEWRAGRLRAGLSVSSNGAAAQSPARPVGALHEFEPSDIWNARPSRPPAAVAD